MAKRNEPVRKITVTMPTYNRFRSLPPYNMPNESILLWLMDEYDKYRYKISPTLSPRDIVKEPQDKE